MIGRQPSARHNTVNVRMRLQSLSPGVQDAEKADLGTEMLWVRGKAVYEAVMEFYDHKKPWKEDFVKFIDFDEQRPSGGDQLHTVSG